jgi:hypothetical protein
MVCQAERLSFDIPIALLLRRLAVLWQPNKQMQPTLLLQRSIQASWGSVG